MSRRGLAILAMLVAALAGGGSMAQGQLLLPYTNVFTGSWAQVVAIGDVNGDGRRDVVVATANSTTDANNDMTVQLFLQTSDGSLAPRVRYTTGVSALGVAVGDINNDSRNDVVVVGSTAAGAGEIVVFRQTTTGTLGTPTRATLPLSPDSVAIGDLNGDGRNDVGLSMVDPTDGVNFTAWVRVYYQLTTGMLGNATNFVVSPGRSDEVEIGDINGDGRGDLVFMRGVVSFASNLVLFRQNSQGTLVPVSYTISNSQATHGIEIAPVTGNGRQDLLFTQGDLQPNSFLGVIPQLSDGTLDIPTFYVAPDFPLAVEAGDVNGDGLADAVVLHPTLGNVSVFPQLPGGVLDTPEVDVVPFGASAVPQALAVGDINGDGEADVAVAHPLFGLVLLLAQPRAPIVLSVAPTANQTNVPTDTTVRATFSQPMQASSISTSTFTLRSAAGPVAGTVTYNATTRTATFTPTQLLAASTLYTARLVGGAGGVKSGAGVPLAQDFTWSFTTGTGGGGGNLPPTVQITSPATGTTVRGVVAVTATASDPDGTVSRVEFLLDGTVRATDTTAPYQWSFDTVPLTVSEGTHTITARAVDNGNLTATDSVLVSVDNTTFNDVAKSAVYFAAVEAIFREGITSGCQQDPPLFCPNSPLTRAQMAVFLVRAMGQSPLDSPTPTFADVPRTNPAYGYIERIAQLGITGGCQVRPVRLFCPTRSLTRQEMAVFLSRAAGIAPFDNPFPTFEDVPRTSPSYPYIEGLYRAGVTQGCSTIPSLFCPTAPLTRAQMAVFLVRAFDIPT